MWITALAMLSTADECVGDSPTMLSTAYDSADEILTMQSNAVKVY